MERAVERDWKGSERQWKEVTATSFFWSIPPGESLPPAASPAVVVPRFLPLARCGNRWGAHFLSWLIRPEQVPVVSSAQLCLDGGTHSPFSRNFNKAWREGGQQMCIKCPALSCAWEPARVYFCLWRTLYVRILAGVNFYDRWYYYNYYYDYY